jgi:MFS family permease
MAAEDPRSEGASPAATTEKPRSEESSEDVQLTPTKSLEQSVSLPREVFVIGLICMAQWTTQMGLGQCIAILQVISDHFGIQDPGVKAWLIAGYSLTVGTFILFSGRIGDLFGWKNMLVIGYLWYAVWSIVAGLAWYSNHVLFVFARIFQGIGPAICLPNGLALLGALYGPSKRKNLAFAAFGACAPVGSVVGSLFAGLWALTWWPCESTRLFPPNSWLC